MTKTGNKISASFAKDAYNARNNSDDKFTFAIIGENGRKDFTSIRANSCQEARTKLDEMIERKPHHFPKNITEIREAK